MKNLINPRVEKVLRQVILKDLSKGRKDFDRPHTEAVVHWMKYMLENIESVNSKITGPKPEIDPQVMITAAYAHDWGYIGLFNKTNSNSFEDIKKKKKLHMKRGADMIERLLYQRLSKHFTEAQIIKAVHLVQFHDEMEKLITDEEILLMEADTLGMLDTDKITPTFSKSDNEKFIKTGIKGRRLPRFIHKKAKNIAVDMIKRREEFYRL